MKLLKERIKKEGKEIKMRKKSFYVELQRGLWCSKLLMFCICRDRSWHMYATDCRVDKQDADWRLGWLTASDCVSGKARGIQSPFYIL
jgi:hypothetical protein